MLEQKRRIKFVRIFIENGVNSLTIPCVDGLRFESVDGSRKGTLYNNGIAEFYMQFNDYLIDSSDIGSYFMCSDVWKYVTSVINGYRTLIPDIYGNQRYFVCLSIGGCKDVITENSNFPYYISKIDRNKLMCHPIAFTNIVDNETYILNLNQLELDYYLSLGIRQKERLNELINKLPGSQ